MTDSELETRKPKLEIRNSKFETGTSVVVEEPPAIDHRQPAIPEEEQSPITHHQSPMTLPLLLEVGCEEIPARFLRDAEKGLGERVEAVLRQARLLPPSEASADPDVGAVREPPVAQGISKVGAVREPPLQTYSTPRRLVVYIPAVLARQPDKAEEVLGPPVKVAIDGEGNYTRAAESFGQKNSARIEDLTRTTTPKGEYLSLRKTTEGRPALEILPEILPGAILGLTFPKSMYWRDKLAPRFVRPIRWMVALWGEGKQAATIEFNILGVKSANLTFGHRAKSAKALAVNSFKDYARKLIQNHVEIDYNRRLERVIQEAQSAAQESAGKVVQDEWLADWIANSTEWPRPMLGSFDERFLHLPREILITVMRDHQRYFAVEDNQGNLLAHFVAVLNMDSDEKGLIRQGHQRVLTARFRDAEFFWNADQKTPLRDRVPLLEKVTYQAKLGSYGDKIRRVKSIAGNICVSLEDSGVMTPGQTREVVRAVELCKCDLTAQMVQEFTELQGIVGGLYAKFQGESEEVSLAIYDHYLPLGAEGASPRTLVGAVVSLADKTDSVVAGFIAGYEPSGSSDPFALRRQANGIIKVLLEKNIPIDLKDCTNKALDVLESQHIEELAADYFPGVDQAQKALIAEWSTLRQKVHARVLDFFAERLRYYFESLRGFRYDSVRAVLAAGSTRPTDALARAEAMEALRGGEDFEALSAAAKRIRNILAKSVTAADWQAGEVVPELLSEPQEKDLYEAYGKITEEVGRRISQRDYRGALEEISKLRPAVDRFFDKVLVMAEDRELRQNRLRLLKKLDELFSGIAHFAEIEGQ